MIIDYIQMSQRHPEGAEGEKKRLQTLIDAISSVEILEVNKTIRAFKVEEDGEIPITFEKERNNIVSMYLLNDNGKTLKKLM